MNTNQRMGWGTPREAGGNINTPPPIVGLAQAVFSITGRSPYPAPNNAVDCKYEPSSGQNVYQGLIETIRCLDRIGDNCGLNHVI